MYATVYTKEPARPSGGPLPGTVRLQRFLVDEFDGTNLGIYNPRDVCGNQWPDWECVGSQHARGAAGDIGFPVVRPEGHADGRRLAAHLVEHHRQLGVQEVIFSARRWTNQTGTWKPYTGRSDHFDHVHYALTADAAVNLTAAEIEATFQTQETQQDEDMRVLVKKASHSSWWITDGISRRWVKSRGEARVLLYAKQAWWDNGEAFVWDAAILDDIPPVGDIPKDWKDG